MKVKGKRVSRVKLEYPPPLQISSLKLERFKAAWKPDPVALDPLTVIIGRNGAGKSTLLEALQWLDTTLRHDAVRACERYGGVSDIMNVRQQSQKIKFFRMEIEWAGTPPEPSLKYTLRVNEGQDSQPIVQSELLTNSKKDQFIKTTALGSGTNGGTRLVYPGTPRERIHDEPDRLALNRGGATNEAGRSHDAIARLREFWQNAVFLRLSPQSLASGSLPHRRSFDPLLDEEGKNLPALLNELDNDQRENLVEAVRSVLPDVRSIKVSETSESRETDVHWSIRERFPTGYAASGTYEVPASMLSEGTRRLTAIFALLARQPAPTLLCIEELENGLDPNTVLEVLKHLQSAADKGTQVLITTHSPWLLDHVQLDSIRLVTRKEGETRYQRFKSEKARRKFVDSVPPGAVYVNALQEDT